MTWIFDTVDGATEQSRYDQRTATSERKIYKSLTDEYWET